MSFQDLFSPDHFSRHFRRAVDPVPDFYEMISFFVIALLPGVRIVRQWSTIPIAF
jgi:hypothetical protein